MSASQALWRGVYPAASTDFTDGFSVDVAATQLARTALIEPVGRRAPLGA